MGWLIAVAVLTLFAILPIGVQVRYDSMGPWAAFMIGPAKVQLYPKSKNVNKPRFEDKQKGKESSGKKKASGGSIGDFLPLVRLVLDFLTDFRTRLAVDHLRLTLILADSDPCDLALNYGKGWAVLGNLMPLLERVLMIKKRDIEVECDFTADKTTVVAGADLTLRVWQLAILAFTHGPGVIKEYFNIMNKRKGGVKI